MDKKNKRQGGFILPLSSILVLFLALFTSCSNDEDYVDTSNQPDVVVTTMGQFMTQTGAAQTRAAQSKAAQTIMSNMQVLQFKDEAVYTATLNKIKDMSVEEKSAYFKKLGFNGAYQILDNADNELDSIFDIEDRDVFERELTSFKSKYNGILTFNTDDEYDASPYLQFTDEDMALVGNIQGYVVIGNKLVAPKLLEPTFDKDNDSTDVVLTRAATGPIQPGFKAFKNSSLTIKNGKYKSTMTIGRIVNGNSFCVEFVTKKKQFLWKKSVKASYTAVLEMSSSKFHHINNVFCPYGKRWAILNLPIETVGTIFNATVTNFKSSRGNAVGSATFKDIRVI